MHNDPLHIHSPKSIRICCLCQLLQKALATDIRAKNLRPVKHRGQNREQLSILSCHVSSRRPSHEQTDSVWTAIMRDASASGKADEVKRSLYFDSHQVASSGSCQKFSPRPEHVQSTGIKKKIKKSKTKINPTGRHPPLRPYASTPSHS